MGEVYLAYDARLGRDVAIKVLPADRAALPGCQTVVLLTRLDSIPAVADMLLVIVCQQKLARS